MKSTVLDFDDMVPSWDEPQMVIGGSHLDLEVPSDDIVRTEGNERM